MSNLDNYHPFRASVQAGSVNSSSSKQDLASDDISAKKTANNDDEEYKPWFSWKTKLRLFIGGAVLSFLIFIGIKVYNYLGLDVPVGEVQELTFLNEMERNQDSPSTQMMYFDKSDLNERGRSIEEARNKAGFFKSFFCKGGKKSSSFCD